MTFPLERSEFSLWPLFHVRYPGSHKSLSFLAESYSALRLQLNPSVIYWPWPSFVVPYLLTLFSLFGGLSSVTLNRYVYNQTRSFVHVFYTIYKQVHQSFFAPQLLSLSLYACIILSRLSASFSFIATCSRADELCYFSCIQWKGA